jgi:hypothetical protein
MMLARSICVATYQRHAKYHHSEWVMMPHRHFGRRGVLVESEYVLQPKQLTLPFLVSRNARKVARLHARIVSNGHLLLLIHLARVDELLDGAGTKQSIHKHIARLSEAICAVHSLQIVSWIYDGLSAALVVRLRGRARTPIWVCASINR